MTSADHILFLILFTMKESRLLECHIYLLFKNSKSIVQVEIEAEIDVNHNVRFHIRSLKSTYAGSFISDLHRKFLFLDFAARKRNISSRPGGGIIFMGGNTSRFRKTAFIS